MRFIAKNGDVIHVGRNLEQFLKRTHTRHTIANQNQFLFHIKPYPF